MKEDEIFFFEYSATCRHTSVAGNMIVFRKAHGVYSIRESRWHRDIIIVLDRIYIDSVRDFFVLQGSKSDPMHACMHKDCLEKDCEAIRNTPHHHIKEGTHGHQTSI